MKALVLDIDGVLNSARAIKRWAAQGVHGDDRIDPRAVKRLNTVTARTGANIVVSSAWRIGRTTVEMGECLHRAGVSGRVVACTPSFRDPLGRGDEIAAWLEGRGGIERIAIVDDDGLGYCGGPHWLDPLLVKTTFATGLQQRHVDALIALLGEA